MSRPPRAYACMVVHRPAEEVFEAFADPAVTTRFWYTTSSGPMVAEAVLRWEWQTYGVAVDVRVLEVERGRLIRFSWGNYEQPTTVEMRFTPREGDRPGTFVEVTEAGFRGSGDDAVQWVNDTVGGFTTVLCAVKALLEQGVEIDVVRDHHPV
ncbi:polyketide cyclase [Streptomyces sp. WAC06614]|nr:polyketide cyclase [Streptomyces sp. WAC06614]